MPDTGNEYRIDYRSLEAGTYEVDYHLDKEFFAMFVEPLVEDGDLDVHVVFKVSEAALQFHFELGGTLEVECDRCLERFSMPVQSQYDMVAKIGEEASPEEENDDFITISSKDSDIDLSKHIYELAVLSLPPQRVHPLGSDGMPACSPDMLARFSIQETSYDEDPDWLEGFSGEDGEEDSIMDECFGGSVEDVEDMETEEWDGSEGGESEENTFQGQEMETIEQKLSKSPGWEKLKSLLNKDINK